MATNTDGPIQHALEIFLPPPQRGVSGIAVDTVVADAAPAAVELAVDGHEFESGASVRRCERPGHLVDARGAAHRLDPDRGGPTARRVGGERIAGRCEG